MVARNGSPKKSNGLRRTCGANRASTELDLRNGFDSNVGMVELCPGSVFVLRYHVGWLDRERCRNRKSKYS